MKFSIYGPDGLVDSVLEAPDETHLEGVVQEGQQVFLGGSVPKVDYIIDGVLVPGTPPEKTYAELRRFEYPPIQDLADALYWQSQGDESKMDDYLAAVQAVKAAHPKPLL